LAGGNGPHRTTADGESSVAGILPELAARARPAPPATLRLQPSRWAGAYACRRHENREAAVWLITGMTGGQPDAANFGIKCFDQAASLYLAIGSVIVAGPAGLEWRLTLLRRQPTIPALPPAFDGVSPVAPQPGGRPVRCRRRGSGSLGW
jgi:glutamine synthetase